MKKVTIFVVLAIANLGVISAPGDSNGTLKGKVIENAGDQTQPVPFANVFLLGTAIGGSTDFDGNFQFEASPGEYQLVVSTLGYKADTISVKIEPGAVVEKTIEVASNAALLDMVQITARADRKNENILLLEQKKAATITQSIGASELAEKGASDVEQGLTKVSGVAKSEANNDIFVRGLGDRYNTATLNGLPIPSSNPDKKVIDLGIFPASIVNSIGVDKTFTPNSQADFSGAAIDIATKDYYENPYAEIGVSGSYNTITTGNRFLQTQSTRRFVFAVGDNSRSLPNELRKEYEKVYYSSEGEATEPIFDRAFNPQVGKAGPNLGASFLGGNSFAFGENGKLGLLVSAQTQEGYQYLQGFARNTDSSGVDKNYFATESYQYGTKSTGLVNVHYEINERNSVQVNGLYTENLTDEVSNFDSEILDRDRNTYTYSTRNTLQTNSLSTAQILGKHASKNDRFYLGWGASYNLAKNAEPDRTQLLFEASNENKDDYRLEALNASDNHRFFSEMTEQELNARVDMSYKFGYDEEEQDDNRGMISIGVQPRFKSRTFQWRQFNMDMRQYADSLQNNDIIVDQLNPDEFLDNDAFTQGHYSYKEARDGSRNHFANQNVLAGYVMLDYAITSRLLVVAGARIEKTQQVIEYKQLRNLLSEAYQTSEYDTLNVLPSMSLKYALTEKSNLRMAFSQTVSRPNFRELAPFQYQDQSRRLYEGNVDLVNGYSYNVDLKYEVFPAVGEVFAISAFGKYIDNPIERYEVPSSTTLFTYFNMGRAIVAGIETEVRTTLGRFVGEPTIDQKRVVDRIGIGLNAAYNYTQLYVGSDDPINTSKGNHTGNQ